MTTPPIRRSLSRPLFTLILLLALPPLARAGSDAAALPPLFADPASAASPEGAAVRTLVAAGLALGAVVGVAIRNNRGVGPEPEESDPFRPV